MNLDSTVCWDPGSDKVYGPHKNMMVIFARGLVYQWKHPIFYDYDIKLTPEVINNIIKELHNVGLNVVSLTCDNAPNNIGLWNQLGISIDNTSFPNPVTQDPVFIFSDPPHLIKLLRNHLLDSGFKLKNGEIVNKQLYLSLLQIVNSEVRECHKLTEKHIYVKNCERQNVRLAFETLSNSVANAIERYLPHHKEASKFIKLANDAFDLLNARNSNEQTATKAPYGKYYDVQTKILDDFKYEIMNMSVIHPRLKSLRPFQKGIIITINSLRGLYKHLQEKIGLNFIITKNINQDIAENAFSILRGIGGFKDHPNSVDAKYRLRMLCISWHMLKPSQNSPVEEHCDNEPKHLPLLKMVTPKKKAEDTVCKEIYDKYEEIQSELGQINYELSAMNWSEVNSQMSPAELCELNGQEYLLGFLVKKFQNKFPDLKLSPAESLRTPQSYTQTISDGNLVVPSYDLMNQFRKWEVYFRAYHNSSDNKWKINRDFQVIERLAEILSNEFPETPKEIIAYYSRVRTFIRIDYLNMKLQRQKSFARNHRKIVQFARSGIPLDNSEDEEMETEPVSHILDHNYLC